MHFSIFLAYLVSGMLNSILPAFYPPEAIAKGATPTEVSTKSFLKKYK